MAIVPIAPVNTAPMTAGLMQIAQGAASPAMASQQALQASPASFQEFFADAVKQTNQLGNEASDAQRSLLVGDSDNLHGVMIAMEKADLAFQMTMAVRNKVIDAYQEVMRMQM
jgi:flagellar hook-basal body complex protein FliE